MKLTDSILDSVKGGLGISGTESFDSELIMHINSALSKLNQNGAGNNIIVEDSSTTWNDFQDPLQVEGNKHFQMIPQFVSLSCKMFFDPPPPSAVEYYSRAVDEMLWRLKIAYE